jgi:hypothetical protein
MEKSIQGYLGSLQLGEVQLFKNLAMVSVVSDYDDGLGYITLGEALGVGSIEIREVSMVKCSDQWGSFLFYYDLD